MEEQSRWLGRKLKLLVSILQLGSLCVAVKGFQVGYTHGVDAATKASTVLFCGSSRCVNSGTNDSESTPYWTSRRGMLTSTINAAAAATVMTPYLFPKIALAATNSNASEPQKSWMADASSIVSSQATAKLLKTQADSAAQRVTQQNIDEYQAFGVTKVKNVISREWLQALRDGCDLAQDEPGPYAEYLQRPTDSGLFFTDLEMARRLPLFAAFSLHGPAAAVAGRVTQSNTIRYLYDQLFVKEQGVSTTTPWHQDGGYWRIKGSQVASVFCPLDPVAPNEGLQFISGSNKSWKLHNPQHFADGTPYIGTSLPEMPDINSMLQTGELDNSSLLTFALEPGDALVFSARTVHGGPGNWGRALSTRWVGDDATFWDRPGEGAVPTIDVQLKDGDSLCKNDLAFPTSWQQQSIA